jgi:hypothetical protein
MPDVRHYGAMTISGNTIVYVGGDIFSLLGTTLVGTISQTDRSEITWTTKAPYPGGYRFRWDAAPWGNNSIIVTGGCAIATTFVPLPECYVYNIDSDTWFPMMNKPTPICAASVGSFRLPNNSWRFVVASGWTGSEATTKTEIYADDSYTVNVNIDVNLPSSYSLDQNYPNPFNPSTTFRFSIANDEWVTLSLFNAIGQRVNTLINRDMKAGKYEFSFNLSRLSSGIYFYRLDAGNYSAVKKLVLMK